MRRFWLTVLFLNLLVAPCLAQYKFTTVDFPGAPQTNLFAVNDEGQYVGALIDNDANMTNHAIFFDGKTLRLLDPNGVIGANFSFALSLNLRGDIVGGYIDGSNVAHGFLYNGGKVTTIDFPGASGTFAFGINDKREIIGVYNDAAQHQHAFLLRKGVFTNIDLPGGVLTVPFSINDWSAIAGQFQDGSKAPGHGYLQLDNGKFTTFDAPGAPPDSTFFISINNFNRILGTWIDTSNVNHNFVLSDGRLRNFDLPKSFQATNVSAQTINDFGEIVGFYFDAQGVQHGFVAIPKGEKKVY
jgi:probable HAF family extracellular repeat protein